MLSLTLLFSVDNHIFAQKEVKVYIQPIISANINSYSVAGTGITKMQKTGIGYGIGINLEYSLNSKFSFSSFIKYYTQKQKIIQDELFAQLDKSSMLYNRWGYFNMNVGGIAQFELNKSSKSLLNILAGASYSHIRKFENNSGYRIRNPVGSFGFRFDVYPEVEDWTTGSDYLNLILGLNRNLYIKRIGHFSSPAP